ncbi:MAG: hypothetical protein INR71_02905 [Terriglobus roseus]|nr:hypothetical protein [Terriglobus roseus]
MSASSQQPRQRQPEPDSSPERKKPRKFAVDPVETSHVSSREKREAEASQVKKAPRKFAVEPVETSHTTNKSDGPKPRRFAPQPVETSHTSSKDKASKASAEKGKPRRFAPQLIETSGRSSNSLDGLSRESSLSDTSKSTRKFAPQLIETAQRSRKAGDDGPTVLHSDRTDAFRYERHKPKRSGSDPLQGTAYGDPNCTSEEIAECRRLGKPLPRRQNSGGSTRSHSVYVPELEPIESSESERSFMEDASAESPSTSPSAGSTSPHQLFQHATRVRESVDGRYTGYFLELAARAAEKQMREQALAAFPNDDRHNPVNHYVHKDDEDAHMSDAWSMTEHDGSAGKYVKINWDMREMQKHANDKAAAKDKERLRKEAWREFNKKTSANGPWGNAAAALYSAGGKDGKDMIGGWQDQVGLAQMRNSARPPMLGKDIKFPRCPSPEPARFDVTQGSEAIRRNMCYLSEQSDSTSKPQVCLWGAKKSEPDDGAALWCKEEEKPEPEKGLWAGFCVGTGETPPPGPTGLMTPSFHSDDPDVLEAGGLNSHQLPPSPPASNSGVTSLDEKLELERAIDEEFDDAFVTQVYNYLSLGYPSMARKFDGELAKISRLEVTELRADDAIVGAGARGYIRLGEENGVSALNENREQVKEEHCARWRALRLYVREWARQQPGWQQTGYGGGVAVRRGSWAW